jgi:hypothetical protein
VPLSDGKVLLVGGASIDFAAYLVSQNIADLAIETRSDCQLYSPSPVRVRHVRDRERHAGRARRRLRWRRCPAAAR